MRGERAIHRPELRHLSLCLTRALVAGRVGWWAAIVVALACWAMPGEALADSFTVTSASDVPFSAPPGGTTFCQTPQPGGTSCTLRAAIQQANILGGLHTITLPARTYTLSQT